MLRNSYVSESAHHVETNENESVFELRIVKSLRCIMRNVDVYSRHLNRKFSLTTPQIICLQSIKSSPLTLSALAKEVNLSAGTVNGVVDRLESKGLAIRERSKKDRRKVFLKLTDKGRTNIAAAPSMLQQRFANALKQLPASEQAAIAVSLERVVDLMETDRTNTRPAPKAPLK